MAKKLDTKAWLRIIEAFLAILIIIGVILIVLSKQGPRADISGEIYEKQRQILDIISKNNTLRDYVLAENNDGINTVISKIAPKSWDYTTEVCLLDDICNSALTPNNQEIYTTEIIITSNLTDYSPKKLRFFVWMK